MCMCTVITEVRRRDNNPNNLETTVMPSLTYHVGYGMELQSSVTVPSTLNC